MRRINETYFVLNHEGYTFLVKKAGVDKNGNMTWECIVVYGNMHLSTWKCQAYTPVDAMERVLIKLKGE